MDNQHEETMKFEKANKKNTASVEKIFHRPDEMNKTPSDITEAAPTAHVFSLYRAAHTRWVAWSMRMSGTKTAHMNDTPITSNVFFHA